jgi:hypothetical protein
LPLKDFKDAYPVQIAEYAAANRIANEPAFHCWVHTVQQKRYCTVAKVKRYWQTTHKFSIRVSKTVKEALAIDEETGTDFWRKALGKEMTKVNVAWKSVDGVTPEQAQTGKEPSSIGFQEIRKAMLYLMSRWISLGRQNLLPEDIRPTHQDQELTQAWFHAIVCDWRS